MRHLKILQSHVFLVNSRLDHFSAPCIAARVPFFRSYGVNLPNSLAMIHSSTSGFSPFPPVSVYGTGRIALRARQVFLQVWLPALSAPPKLRGTVGFHLSTTTFNELFRQFAAVSLLGLEDTRYAGAGMLTGSASCAPLGFHLAPD